MAAFPHQSFVLDSAYLTNTNSTSTPLDQVGDLSMTNATPFYYFPTNPIPELSSTHQSSSSHDSERRNFQGSEGNSKNQGSLEKKRKDSSQKCCSSSAQPNGAKEGKSRKHKKCSDGLKETGEEDPLRANEGETKASREPPTGYIHVRARRGQATDSHSLAERVRREKISERMKLLQGLVPGCDKVTGKALMLDEIINYVQSLQNQVEFLSLKLASANPMSYDFAMDVNDYMIQPQRLESMSPPMASVQQTSHIQHIAFPADTTNNYPMLDTSATILLHGQGPSASSSQDNGSFVMQVGGHRQELLNQVEFNGMCNFQWGRENSLP